VENLAEMRVDTLEEAMNLIECGKSARVTHANAVHADSSRCAFSKVPYIVALYSDCTRALS
jgi:hypothetical protein